MNKPNPVDTILFSKPDFHKMVDEVAQKAVKSLNPDNMVKSISKSMSSVANKMCMAILGFKDDGFGRLNMDDKNRDSTLYKALLEKTSEAAKLIIDKCVIEMDKIDVSADLINAMRDTYTKELKYQIKNLIERRISEKIKELTDERLQELLCAQLDGPAELLNSLHQSSKAIKDPEVAKHIQDAIGKLERHLIDEMKHESK